MYIYICVSFIHPFIKPLKGALAFESPDTFRGMWLSAWRNLTLGGTTYTGPFPHGDIVNDFVFTTVLDVRRTNIKKSIQQ